MTCLAVAAALSGCGDPMASVKQMAESTRDATEQMAQQSREASIQKELAYGGDELRRRPGITLVERYETRQGPDGYFLYDTQEHTVARYNGRPMTGLSLYQAGRAADAMAYADSRPKSAGVSLVRPK